MAKTLVVAEKPSVGKDIGRVLGCRERGEGCLILGIHRHLGHRPPW